MTTKQGQKVFIQPRVSAQPWLLPWLPINPIIMLRVVRETVGQGFYK